jgi:hypothetical protein
MTKTLYRMVKKGPQNYTTKVFPFFIVLQT